MVASAPAPTFRTIEALAELCGRCAWAETRLFELTGQWANGNGPPEWRVFCSVASAHHAALASEWRSRLPVRAGVDQEALICPPPDELATAIDGLSGQSVEDGLPVLIGHILPDLGSRYRAILEVAAPVREAPVMALLARAAALHAGVTERGIQLLQ